MIQAISISNSTAVRASVIARRTQNAEIGMMKAMMIDNLKTKLANGVAHFIFVKKNGELSEAWGTTQANIAQAMTTGTGESREAYCTTSYYDVTLGAWRSFRWESIVKVF